MNPTTQLPPHDAAAGPSRPGLTLLEVLVACGILVMGLASVAALLPAAASVLADASATDRAGGVAANAAVDLMLRGTLKATDFTAAAPTAMVASSGLTLTLPGIRRLNVEPTAVDEQAYGNAWYLATATPLAAGVPARRGDPARVTVAAFKRANAESRPIALSRQSTNGTPLPPGVFRLSAGAPSQQETDRRRFLPPCGWAVAVSGTTVRWLHVGSSWATYQPGGKDVKECFVSFSDPDGATAAASGDSLTVHGLSGVVRVEERIIPLD